MFLRFTSTHSLVLRSNDSTDKINSDHGTVALARLTSHTGCTQALWRELGVRRICVMVVQQQLPGRSKSAQKEAG